MRFPSFPSQFWPPELKQLPARRLFPRPFAVDANVRHSTRGNVEAAIADPASAYGTDVENRPRLDVGPLVRLVVLSHPEKSAGVAPWRGIEALRIEFILFTPYSGRATVTPKNELKIVQCGDVGKLFCERR